MDNEKDRRGMTVEEAGRKGGENFISCILPGIDTTKNRETIFLKCCLVRIKDRIYRTLIIIRM